MNSSDWVKVCQAEGWAWASVLGQAGRECIEGIVNLLVWLGFRAWEGKRLGCKAGAGAR